MDGQRGMVRLVESARRLAERFHIFRVIMSYLRKQIDDFGVEMMGNAMQWVSGLALTLLTLWIMIQGYRIVTGQSRESMMALVTN